MAGGLLGFALAGAAKGWGDNIAEQGKAKREAAMEDLKYNRILEREQTQRDFEAGQAELKRGFTAEQNQLDRDATRENLKGDSIIMEDGTLGVLRGSEVERVTGPDGNPIKAGAQGVDKDSFDRERYTRKDYGDEPDVKTYQDVRNSYERVRASAETDSGPGDIGLIFNFMKMLDPGSVVREGEFATAENAGGVSERVRNMYNSLIRGERLSPSMRSEFVTAADKLYAETSKNLEAVNERYGPISEAWRIDPTRVLIQPEQYEPLKLGETREYDGKIKVKRIGD